MTDHKGALRGGSALPDLIGQTRLRREREEAKARKQRMQADRAISALGAMGTTVPLDVGARELAVIADSQYAVTHMANYLQEMAAIGVLAPGAVSLANIPEECTPDKRVIVAQTERQIMAANVLATLNFLLGCPGSNNEMCGALWRLYEGLQYVEETGQRFHAFEPAGVRTTGAPASFRHTRRKAAVSAAIWAYMQSGLSEQQALDAVMAQLGQTEPSHWGLPAHKPLEAETVLNWRRAFNKGRSGSDQALELYGRWLQAVTKLKKEQPNHLVPWAERALYLAVTPHD